MKNDLERIERMLGRKPGPAELFVFRVAWRSPHRYTHSAGLSAPSNGPKHPPFAHRHTTFDMGHGLRGLVKLQGQTLHSLPANLSLLCQSVSPEFLIRGARPVTSLLSLQVQDKARQTAGKILERLNHDNPAAGILAWEVRETPHSFGQGQLMALTIGLAKEAELVRPDWVEAGDALFGVEIPQGETALEAFLKDVVQYNATRCLEVVSGKNYLEPITLLCLETGMGVTLEMDPLQPLTPEPALQNDSRPAKGNDILIIAKREKENELHQLILNHGLLGKKMGQISGIGLLEVYQSGKKTVSVPLSLLVSEPATYIAEGKTATKQQMPAFKLGPAPLPSDLAGLARRVFDAQKTRWRAVAGQANLSGNWSSDAVVFNAESLNMAVAMAGLPTYASAAPYAAGLTMAACVARRLICSGARPVGAVLCSHGMPLSNDSTSQQLYLIESGIRDACRHFGIPLQENWPSGALRPLGEEGFLVPGMGMLGLIDEGAAPITLAFKAEGDRIFMLGNSYNDLGGSDYLKVCSGQVNSLPPHFDLQEEREVQQYALKLIRKGLVRSAHNVSGGGLLVSLLDSALAGGLGFNIETVETFRKDCFLFGESQGRILLTIAPENEDEVIGDLVTSNVSFAKLGEVLGQELIVDAINLGSLPEWKAKQDESRIQQAGLISF